MRVDKINDVVLIALIGGTGNARRFIQGEIDRFGLILQEFAVYRDLITCFNPIAFPGHLAVNLYPTGIDPFIGLAPGTDPGTADVFVQTDGSIRHALDFSFRASRRVAVSVRQR